MEKVEIVDEHSNVVGITTKLDAHRRGLLHKTVIAELKDSKNRWLFVKQSDGRQDKGQFVSPMGGHIRAGESDEKALKREVFEELGITDFKFKFKGKIIFNRKVKKHTENHYFLVYEIYSDATPILNNESVGFIRLSTAELKKELKSNITKFGAPLIFILQNLYPELY